MRRRRRQRLLLVVGVVALVGAGCAFREEYGGTMFSCDPGTCLDGQTCVEHVCQGAGALDGAPVDAPVDVPDAPPGTPDGPPGVCELAAQAPDNDGCIAAIDLDGLANAPDGVIVYGDTTDYADSLAPQIPATCTGAFQQGRDAIYELSVIAGDHIEATLSTEGWNGALYALEGCTSAATCHAQPDNLGIGDEELIVNVTSAGIYRIVVDSSAADQFGCYTLQVTLTHP